MVALFKSGAGGAWTLAVAFLTTGILVTAQPLSRNGEAQAEGIEGGAGGPRAGGSGEGGGGGDRSNGGPMRFREPGQLMSQEAMLRNLDALGGGHLLRDLDPYGDDRMHRQSRGFDSVVGTTFGGYKRLDPLVGTSFGGQKRSGGRLSNAITQILKRNFDEIDRSGFDSFVKRNNFDEIDRYGFDGFVRKRRSGVAAPQSSSDANNPGVAETVISDNGLDQH